VGPLGVSRFLLGFSGITEDRLAALTVTSPFSAAFSVPTPARSGFSTAVDPFERSQLVTGLNLPVWTVYLALTPLLCLVLYGVTYLAFRWRWWRASNTI
ncbi:MAG: ABC transporter permease, partial [Isosphaeraceae bacterium]